MGPATIYIAAKTGRGPRQAFELMVPEMGVHVPETDDSVAEMAFRGSAAVRQFVGGETREQQFRVWGFIGIATLGNLEVTEAAEDEF